MHRSHLSFFWYAAIGISLAVACGPQPIEVPDDDEDTGNACEPSPGNPCPGTGATGGQGGSYGGGVTGGFSGATSTGGFPTGGFSGTTPTGGAFTGGVSGTSGTTATGGAFPTGGTPATGGVSGTPATGGVSGTPATGGVAGTPATGGAAGSPATMCEAAWAAGADGFIRAPGTSGCWHGYAYAGGDTGSTVMPTTFAMCGAACMLRVSGTLGPATAANAYAGVAFLGFNINQTAGASVVGTMAPTGTSLVVTYTKTAGPATIRAQIQAGANRWCANLTASPATIPYTSFNTACWDMTGTAYAKQPIEAVQLVAPGEMAAMPIDMTLVSVKDM